MKQRKATARRRMNMVICEINNVIMLAGGHTVDLRLCKEEKGLRLYVRGDFKPEKREQVLRAAQMLRPAVRDLALVETYGELAGDEQKTGDSELVLVGHMLDSARVSVGDADVRMELYLAF